MSAGPGKKRHFFDEPANERRVLRLLYATCALVFVLDIAGVVLGRLGLGELRHAERAWEGWPGFYSIYGFVACVALVSTAEVNSSISLCRWRVLTSRSISLPCIRAHPRRKKGVTTQSAGTRPRLTMHCLRVVHQPELPPVSGGQYSLYTPTPLHHERWRTATARPLYRSRTNLSSRNP